MKLLWIFLVLTFTGPLYILISGQIDFTADYRTANRDSARISPLANETNEAIIQVFTARAFNWRGIFSEHVWLTIKPKDAKQFTVYQVIGWRLLRGLPPLVIMADIPDRNWFDKKPRLILELRGIKAEQIIEKIEKIAPNYPYANQYITWPGPNSNTFIAWLGRQIPEMNLVLPSNAIGKDYMTQFFSPAPSGTGYQFSVFGLFGVMLAKYEGFEINILGLVYGFSPVTHTLKLPGFGDIILY